MTSAWGWPGRKQTAWAPALARASRVSTDSWISARPSPAPGQHDRDALGHDKLYRFGTVPNADRDSNVLFRVGATPTGRRSEHPRQGVEQSGQRRRPGGWPGCGSPAAGPGASPQAWQRVDSLSCPTGCRVDIAEPGFWQRADPAPAREWFPPAWPGRSSACSRVEPGDGCQGTEGFSSPAMKRAIWPSSVSESLPRDDQSADLGPDVGLRTRWRRASSTGAASPWTAPGSSGRLKAFQSTLIACR